MSRKKDIEVIKKILPSSSVANLSARQLRDTRAILETLRNRPPSPKWEKAMRSIRDLSDLQPMLDKLGIVGNEIRARQLGL